MSTVDLEELKKLLSDFKLSQSWAAKQVGVTAAYFGSILAGKMQPSSEIRANILDLKNKLKRSGLRAV